jgi:hypothetical protein
VSLDTGLILDAKGDPPLAVGELSSHIGCHSKTSWVRMGEGCEVPRLSAKSRGFSSFLIRRKLGLRLVEG